MPFGKSLLSCFSRSGLAGLGVGLFCGFLVFLGVGLVFCLVLFVGLFLNATRTACFPSTLLTWLQKARAETPSLGKKPDGFRSQGHHFD